MKIIKVIIVLSLLFSSVVYANSLTDIQKKELTLFGMKAMGMNVDIANIKKVLSVDEVNEMVATGLNFNGHLCAKLTAIKPLRVKSTYEATCIAYEGGSSKKHYIIDALKGVAFVP